MATQRTPLTIFSWLVWRADFLLLLILVYPLSFMTRGECFEVYVRVCDVLVRGTMYFFFDERGCGWGGSYKGGVIIYCLFIPYSFCTIGFVTIHFHIKLCWMLVCFINIHFIFHVCWCLQSWYRIQVIEPLLRTRELRKRMFNTVLLPISDQELNPHSQARHCSIQTFKMGHWSWSKVFFFFFKAVGQKFWLWTWAGHSWIHVRRVQKF